MCNVCDTCSLTRMAWQDSLKQFMARVLEDTTYTRRYGYQQWRKRCREKIGPPYFCSSRPKISKYLDPPELDLLWNILSPYKNLPKRMYKGGPNISPEITDPPSISLAHLTFYISYVLLMNPKVVQILAKNYMSLWMQGVQIFHLKYLLPLP